MKHLVFGLAALFLGSAFADVTIPSDKSKFLIVVLAGQSNMAGRGYLDEDPSTTNAHPRVVKQDKEGNWVPCVDPIHYDKSGAGAGLGKKFAEMLAEAHPDCMVGVVPTAVGGTSITQWLPGAIEVQYDQSIMYLYGDFTNRTFRALQDGTLTAILWHQGESNCSRGTGYLYQTYFPVFLEAVRRDFAAAGLPRCPFIAGSLFDPTGFFENAQANCQIDWCSYLEGPGAFVMTDSDYERNEDNIHFTTKTQLKFGQRYYEAYTNVVAHLAVDPDYWKTNVWTEAMKKELYETCGRDLKGVKYVNKGIPVDQLNRVEFDIMSEKGIDWMFPDGVPYVPQGDSQTAAVTFNTNTCTLTFYCDKYDHSGEGITVFSNLVSITSSATWNGIASQVTNVVFDASFAAYRPYTLYRWFYDMKNLTSITGIEYLNTSETTSMEQAFYNCESLETLDVSGFDTSAVQNFSMAFRNCKKLTELDLSGFRTTRVNTFANMLNGCTSLTNVLDLTHFSVARLNEGGMQSMLSGCKTDVKVNSDFAECAESESPGYTFTDITKSVSKKGVRVMTR